MSEKKTGTPSRLELTVKAKSSDILMGLHIWLDLPLTTEFDQLRRSAFEYARLVGYLYHEGPMPLLFEDGYELLDGWKEGRAQVAQELRERTRNVASPSLAHKNERPVENGDSLMLAGTPSPEEALRILLSGESLRIEQYTVLFADGVTWLSNPYGQDSALGNHPDLEMISRFLLSLAEKPDYQ